MSGTEKKKLLNIGKSQKPRCFKGVKSLPVDYANNRKAWLTSELFEIWLRDWYRDLVKKKKKILLLVDNCPAHPNVTDLKSITLAFLPPNTTSVSFIESHNGVPIQLSEHEFDEDDNPLCLWFRNLNSVSLAAPEMWEDYVDID
nr:tigger transposable element-derived protein 4-like [Danaus plexippus plexippus]